MSYHSYPGDNIAKTSHPAVLKANALERDAYCLKDATFAPSALPLDGSSPPFHPIKLRSLFLWYGHANVFSPSNERFRLFGFICWQAHSWAVPCQLVWSRPQ